jgi:hypothetical protein
MRYTSSIFATSLNTQQMVPYGGVYPKTFVRDHRSRGWIVLEALIWISTEPPSVNEMVDARFSAAPDAFSGQSVRHDLYVQTFGLFYSGCQRFD